MDSSLRDSLRCSHLTKFSNSGRSIAFGRKNKNTPDVNRWSKVRVVANRKLVFCLSKTDKRTEWQTSLSYEQAISLQTQEAESRLFRYGPPAGDLSEVEAFCRMYRLAEDVHRAVMEALRNSSNKVPVPAQNGSTWSDGDVSVEEERIVSTVARIGNILQKYRPQIVGNSGQKATPATEPIIGRIETYPPLAALRAEVKETCSVLEVALQSKFPSPPSSPLSPALRQTLRLKNLSLDAGFPRPTPSPPHADLPNFSPVSLTPSTLTSMRRTGDPESPPLFFRGGQPTLEGLEYLSSHGFGTLVDLRGDQDWDPIVATNAGSYGLKYRRLPLEQGQVPSQEQLEALVGYLGDLGDSPKEGRMVYLFSQGGVGRAAAMVNCWRSFASMSKGNAKDNGSLRVKREEESDEEGDEDMGSGMESSEDEDEVPRVPGERVGMVRDPMSAQLPGGSVFSRQSMAEFSARRRKKVPEGTSGEKGPGYPVVDVEKGTIAGPAGYWGLAKPGIPRAGMVPEPAGTKESAFTILGSDSEPAPDVTVQLPESSASSGTSENGNGPSAAPSESSEAVESDSGTPSGTPEVPEVPGPAPAVDMCSSTTGVVRVQSRGHKAEMYLVRTDGFSCTREKVRESSLAFSHPSTQQQMLLWKTRPKVCLVLKKLGDELLEETQQVATFLHEKQGVTVLVEPDVHDSLARIPGFGFVQTFYNQDTSTLHERVDFVICLGGDGVILHASNLFSSAVPPIVSFCLGSLGFLTAHPFSEYETDLGVLINGPSSLEGVYITLRMRLRCEIFRQGKAVPGKVFEVLNEVVLDRGSNPYLCKIECYERNRLITKVQADGVIVATPTGSTAYSTAAGGSMVHPNVPCMLFTPICPHSLSFRPVILPDSALLELKVPDDARSNAWVSFDGKKRQQLSKGDSICVRMSEHPMPTVNKSDQTDDWFQSLVRCLNWNERLEQKQLIISP